MKNSKKSSKGSNEIKDILSSGPRLKQRVINDFNRLEENIKTLKAMGFKIVLTQGVYDLIHIGHATYLDKAKSFGDILVVGVDSDELTRKRKGPDRPIVSQKERLAMLSHLRSVDLLTIREAHHDIGDLIRLIKPDILVISEGTKDFTSKMADEYKEFCGKIISLPPQATTSTTARLRSITIESVDKLAKEVTKLANDFIKKIRSN